MKQISIIVPIYNVEKYLDKCVMSILGQTFKNFELILIDDGSPDNCPAICDCYAEQEQRIRVIHQRNAGVAVARNIGLKEAMGKYVLFVDSDDLLMPMACEKLIQQAEENQADIVDAGNVAVYETGKRVEHKLALEN